MKYFLKITLPFSLFFFVFLGICTTCFAQSYNLSQLEGVWRGKTSTTVVTSHSQHPYTSNYENENYRISVQGQEILIYIESSRPGAFHKNFNYQNSGPIFRVKFNYFDLTGTYYQQYGNKYGCNPAKKVDASGEVSQDFKTISLKFYSKWAAPWAASAGAPITGCDHPNHMNSTVTMKKLG